jgi:son of sevenless
MGLLTQVGQGQSCAPGVNPRWFAPELISQSGPTSTHSDIWSFGMLCLELMTGQQPFSELPRDINVMFALANKQTPQRPTKGVIATSEGLGQEMWSLMLKCWRPDPTTRPHMTELKLSLDRLRAEYSPSQNGGPSRIESDLSTPTRPGASGSSFSGRRPSTGASSAWSANSSRGPLDSSHGSPATSQLVPDVPRSSPRRPPVSTSHSGSPYKENYVSSPASPPVTSRRTPRPSSVSTSNSGSSSHSEISSASPASTNPRRKPSKTWSIMSKFRSKSSINVQSGGFEADTHYPNNADVSSRHTATKRRSSHAGGRDHDVPFLHQHGRTDIEAASFDDLIERLVCLDSGTLITD